ncbi:jg2720, partial [Pararge aegeria aegeria]
DAKNVVQHRPDNDYLVYDEPAEQPERRQELERAPAQDDDYDYVQDSSERSKTMREFGTAVDQFWNQKKNKKKKEPAFNDYRSVHFGDRDLANELRDRSDQSGQNYVTHEALTQGPASDAQSQPRPALEEEEEGTTSTQNPRRRLKPRVLPPSEKNPNLIDTITVRVPPIYKEKRPRKLHRERPQQTEAPERSDHEEESVYKPYDYTYPGSDGTGYYTGFSPYPGRSSSQYNHASDAESENSEQTYQTEQPKRKRRRKNKRRIRSVHKQQYTAGDFDYYGKRIPISEEEEYFRGLTIPPPTVDADLARLEQAQAGDGHFLDDHERIREDPERIKSKTKAGGKK